MKLFDRVFKRLVTLNKTRFINELSSGSFTAWNGNAYENDIFRGAVDSIARNCGKLKGSHIISYSDHTRSSGDCSINRLLQNKPNEYMNAYDFLYKMVTRYFIYNNAFALIDRDDKGNLRAVYPITSNHVEVYSNEKNELFLQFTFNSGKQAIFNYKDVIHIRRHFNNNDFLGDNNGALQSALELAHTENEGIINGIKSGASIRGILHFTQIMSPQKLKEEKENFINDYLQISNEGGVVATDQKAEYTPIDSKPILLNAEQSEAIKKKIYNYLGITEKIVNSSYSEDEFLAFYESTIEPIALALGLEFTNKVFTDRERAFGNSIIFESGRLQFTSNKTKVELIKELAPMGILSINQALEILNLPSVTDGDKRLLSLNFIDEKIASEYQLNKSKKGA